MKFNVKKKEDKLKRIQKFHEKKREREGVQKQFLEGMAKNMRIAAEVKAGNIAGVIGAMQG